MMKKTILLFSFLICTVLVFAQDKKQVKINNKDGKYELTVEKEVNGEKTVETKTYNSREEMMSDPALEDMNIFVMDGESHSMKIESKDGEEKEMSFNVIVETSGEEGKNIEHKKSNVMVFEADDMSEAFGMTGEFDFEKDDDGEIHIYQDGKEIVGDEWVDEDGNEFKIKRDNGKVMIINGKGNFEWNGEEDIHLDFTTEDENNGDHKVIMFKSGGDEDMHWVQEDGKTIKIKEVIEDQDVDGETKVMIFNSEGGEITEWTNDGDEQVHIKKIIKKQGVDEDGNVFIIRSDGDLEHQEVDKDVQVFVKKIGGGSEQVKVTIKVVEKLNLHIGEVESGDFEELMNAKAKDLKLDDIKYYPNPNSGSFNLEFVAPGKPTSVKVISLDGKEVYSEELNGFEGAYSNEIDLSDQNKGMYLLRIQQGSRTINKKIVIE